MDKKIYYNELYDCYRDLFTEKQRAYFEGVYFQDYSLAEIALNEGVSRNAVHHQIKIVLEKLEFYERVLKIVQKNKKILEVVQNVDDKTKQKIEKILEG